VLTENDFPRWVHGPDKQTKLVESVEEHAKALKTGWYGTIGEVPAEVPAKTDETLPDYTDHDAPADEPLPTRAELEAKAAELELKYHPNLGDARLAALIQEKLED
jgi:hypothetical protein